MRTTKPSPNQIRMLRKLAAGKPWHADLSGRSEHGGAEKTLYSLARRGWIINVSKCELTQAGRQVLIDNGGMSTVAQGLTMDQYGKDHWSLLGYVDCCCVDHGGQLDKRKLRTNENTHPVHAVNRASVGAWRLDSGTRLKGYFPDQDPALMLPDHDDWDCLEDMERAGLLEIMSEVNALVRLTAAGSVMAGQLERTRPAAASSPISPRAACCQTKRGIAVPNSGIFAFLEPQLVAPRHAVKQGVDHGRDGKILARGPKVLEGRWLVWRPGGTYWSGLSGNRYAPAQLVIQRLDYQYDRMPTVIHEGGRLSRKLILLHQEAIDKEFGAGAAVRIDVRHTLVVG